MSTSARRCIFLRRVNLAMKTRPSSRPTLSEVSQTLGPAAVVLLALGLSACGGPSGSGASTAPAAPTVDEPEPEDFPADASAVHYHPMHPAAFGPWWGSGCPDQRRVRLRGREDPGRGVHLPDGPAGRERDPGHDLPLRRRRLVGRALRRGQHLHGGRLLHLEARRRRHPAPRRATAFAASSISGAAATTPSSTERASDPAGEEPAGLLPGRRLLGRRARSGSSEFMQSAIPGDWECVAKAYQNREPSTSNTGLSKWANAAYVGDLSYDYAGLEDAVTPDPGQGPLHPRPLRRAHRLRLPRRRHSGRGRLLPAPPLRGAPARDGAHPVRQQPTRGGPSTGPSS